MKKKMGIILGVLVIALLLSAGCAVQPLANNTSNQTLPGAKITRNATGNVTAADIAGILSTKPQFSDLVTAIKAANLTNTFNKTITPKGNYTVFAPTDTAVNQSSSTIRQKLLSSNQSERRAILLDHVVNGSYSKAQLLKMGKVTTLSGKTITFNGTATNLTLNKNVTVGTRFNATNGIVYSIDKVLVLPVSNVTPTKVTPTNTTTTNTTNTTKK